MKKLLIITLLFFGALQMQAQAPVFDALLKSYVDNDGNVDYKGLRKSKPILNVYLKDIEKTIPGQKWSSNKAKAFWINVYNQLEKINISKDFTNIEIVETPIFHGGMPGILYSLGGSYFHHGRYKESSQIDEQLLKVWPNHLDALWRFGFAKHKLNQNNKALEIAEKFLIQS